LKRLARGAALEKNAETFFFLGGKRVFRISDEKSLIFAQRVRQKRCGFAARLADSARSEQLGRLSQCFGNVRQIESF
jgi:hypothetical protein